MEAYGEQLLSMISKRVQKLSLINKQNREEKISLHSLYIDWNEKPCDSLIGCFHFLKGRLVEAKASHCRCRHHLERLDVSVTIS